MAQVAEELRRQRWEKAIVWRIQTWHSDRVRENDLESGLVEVTRLSYLSTDSSVYDLSELCSSKEACEGSSRLGSSFEWQTSSGAKHGGLT